MSNDTDSPGDDEDESTDVDDGGEFTSAEESEAGQEANQRADTEDEEESPSREGELEKRADRLDQRELGLDKRAEDLEEREATLDERETDLRERSAELEDYREELEAREDRIAERETELDEREAAIEEEERRLQERAEELDRKEQTLRNYVGEQVVDIEQTIGATVQESVSSALVHYEHEEPSRLSATGTLVVALIGLAVIAGGAVNATLGMIDGASALLSNQSSNLAVSGVLVLVGLAANLAAVTNRI